MADTPSPDIVSETEGWFANGTTASDTPTPVAMQALDAQQHEQHQQQEQEQQEQARKGVDNVLYSDIGINTLLTRLKQSIASARDFAAFLKKRSSIEEDHANGLRRLAKAHMDTIHKPDLRQGTHVRQLDEVMRLHERMADNGMQYALSLHQMHEDLAELSRNIEGGRKHWKHEGLNAEKRATDAETAMDKAKAKYDSLAEDYDRARTGDAKSSRRLGLKGPKSAAQVEEDVLRKLHAADADYQQKVQAARTQREELLSTARPQAVKSLQELVVECDSGLALQLQKFATFNEKLLLGNGLVVAPLPSPDGAPPTHRSMRDVVFDIDNHKDFHSFILSHTAKVPARKANIEYKQHPTLLPKQQNPNPPDSRQLSASLASPPLQSPPVTFSGPASQPLQYNPLDNQTSLLSNQSPSPSPQLPSQPPQQTSYPTPSPPSGQSHLPPPTSQYNNPPYPSSGSSVRNFPLQTAPSQPYPNAPTYATNGVGSAMGQQQSYNHSQLPPPPQPTPPTTSLPPLKPVFGVSLEELFRRDGSAVPMVVYQCMQAVDLFGLDVEGIYRVSGTAVHVQQLKALFDHDSSAVDFRNPTTFSHDINSVAGLLKTFFRDLPDPLLTQSHYSQFIEAARIEDEIVRRDTVHAIINDLPDSNYATLRALVLHLERVKAHEGSNRMGTSNLSICFAPTLMGSHAGPQIADAALQARVVSTILSNTYQIFDED